MTRLILESSSPWPTWHEKKCHLIGSSENSRWYVMASPFMCQTMPKHSPVFSKYLLSPFMAMTNEASITGSFYVKGDETIDHTSFYCQVPIWLKPETFKIQMCQTRVNALDEYILVVEKWRLNSLSPLLLHLRAVSDTQYQKVWPQNIRLRKFARISKSISLWVQSPRLVDSKRFYFPGRQLWRVFLPSEPAPLPSFGHSITCTQLSRQGNRILFVCICCLHLFWLERNNLYR